MGLYKIGPGIARKIIQRHALAYLASTSGTNRKCFITLTPGVSVKIIFFFTHVLAKLKTVTLLKIAQKIIQGQNTLA